jgi:hypothetical protein
MTVEEVKQAINSIQCASSEVEWDYPLDYAIAFDHAIVALEHELDRIGNEAAEQTNGWIPVSERTPETERDVLIYAKKNTMALILTGYYWRDAGVWYVNSDCGTVSLKVTHWRELPDEPGTV